MVLIFAVLSLIGGTLLLLAATSPTSATRAFALLAVAVAFMSASQDVVIDAYRTDLLPARERGLGSSLNVMGYRLAMIVSGGVALIWTDATQGSGWSWPDSRVHQSSSSAAACSLRAQVCRCSAQSL